MGSVHLRIVPGHIGPAKVVRQDHNLKEKKTINRVKKNFAPAKAVRQEICAKMVTFAKIGCFRSTKVTLVVSQSKIKVRDVFMEYLR